MLQKLCLLLLPALLLGGCGLKYDLYLPDEDSGYQAGAHQQDGQLTLFSTEDDSKEQPDAAEGR